jgi:hypothetical protein
MRGLVLMKRKAIALTIILALLVTTQVGWVNANFYSLGTTPPPLGTIPPTITVFYSENQIFTQLLVNITSAWSPTKYSSFSLPEVYYKGDWMANESFAGYGEGTFRLPLNTAPSGTHSVTIRAEQGCFYGNEDGVPYYFRTDISLIVTFIVERTQPFSAKVLTKSILNTTPPNISVLFIENKTFVNSTVPLDFTVNDLVAKISYSLDGHGNVTIAGNTTLTGLSNGEHYIMVYYTDIAGNVGASETVYFNVEVPFPTALVIASVISVVVVGAGVLVYFRKRKHAKINKQSETAQST